LGTGGEYGIRMAVAVAAQKLQNNREVNRENPWVLEKQCGFPDFCGSGTVYV